MLGMQLEEGFTLDGMGVRASLRGVTCEWKQGCFLAGSSLRMQERVPGTRNRLKKGLAGLNR